MDYIFKKTSVSEDSILAYANLLSSVFKSTDKFSFEYLNWQYKQNPNGTVVGFDAYWNDKLVAHYVTIPVLYMLNGKETKGLLSLNTATHPNHQGKGLFTRLATKTFEEGTKLGYSFVIGVANQNSTHGFVKKLGFSLITSLKVKTGRGKITFSEDDYSLKPLWGKESINWRLSNPSTTYYKKKEYIVAKASSYGMYAQLFSIKNNDILKEIKPGKTSFNLWIGLAKNIKTKGVFITLPQNLKPAPLNLIFKDLTGNIPVPNKEDILFELIDFDIY